MDDFTRRIVAEAIAQDDFVRRDFDCWQSQRQQQQREQQELKRRQAAHAAEQRAVRAWLTQTAGDEVKTTDFYTWARAIARVEAIKLDNDLVDDLEKFNDALQQRFNRRKEYFEKQDASLQVQIDELKSDIASLRAEVADLREIIGDENNNTRSNVLPLLTLEGRRDVA
jgi:hypothetical protein